MGGKRHHFQATNFFPYSRSTYVLIWVSVYRVKKEEREKKLVRMGRDGRYRFVYVSSISSLSRDKWIFLFLLPFIRHINPFQFFSWEKASFSVSSWHSSFDAFP